MTPADLGARARLAAAFARQERRGLMLATGARSVAVLVIVAWVALTNPERGLAHAWVLGTALLLGVTGVVQFWLYARDLAPALTPYLFALVDSLVLAAVFVAPNPFAPAPLPVAIPLRYGNFVFFFVLLMQTAFSFRPRLLLWSGLCGAAAWTLAFLWVVTRPGVLAGAAPRLDVPSGLATYLDPGYVHAGRGDDAGRGDGDAARLSRADGGRGVPPRRLPGEVHRRRAAGDLRRARRRGPRRHRRAGLRAADAGGLAGLERPAGGGGAAAPAHGRGPALRPGRARRHRQPAQHGLRDGGDTINVASRLQGLTRDLDASIVASDALVTAVEREAVDRPLLHDLARRGTQTLRGRDTPVEVWAG